MGSQGPGQLEDVVEDDGQVPSSVDSADVVPIQTSLAPPVLFAEERSEISNPIPNQNPIHLQLFSILACIHIIASDHLSPFLRKHLLKPQAVVLW